MPNPIFNALQGSQSRQKDFGLSRQKIDAAAAQFRQSGRDPAREWAEAKKKMDPRVVSMVEELSQRLASRFYG